MKKLSISDPTANKMVTLVDVNEKYSLELCQKTEVSHNTRKFRFKLPSDQHYLGLPVGQCVYLSARVNGKLVVRPYTPISSDDDLGYCEIMVKVYFSNNHPQFPQGGKMSQHLESMKIGDSIEFRGPSGKIQYKRNGKFTVKQGKDLIEEEKIYKHISMVAGGSGITPMLQVIQDVLKNGEDQTKIRLIYANQTEGDILCRSELDELAKKNPERFSVWYTLSKQPSEAWAYSTGYVNEEMFKNHLFPASTDNVVLLCGPPGMIKQASSLLDQLEYNPTHKLLF